MKILYVSNLYGELARGGAEKIVAAEAEAFACQSDDVVVVTAERQREIPEGVCLPGEPWLCPPGDEAAVSAAYAAAVGRAFVRGKPRLIRYYPSNFFFYADDHRHGYAARFFWHLRDMANRASARTFARILDLERPDVVHTHNLMGLGFLLPCVVRRAGIRHVHTVHDVQLLHPSGLIAGGGRSLSLAQRVYAALMRRLMGSPDVVVFPSRFLLDLHERFGFFRSSRRLVVRNPAPSVPERPRAAPDAPRFLFVGQLERHKGVMLLLDAWDAADIPGAALEIAGAGAMEKDVRERAARSRGVAVLGRLEGDALAAAYDRAAFVVVPSLVIENQPAVILEAFARGTPVIAAATGGIPELVRENETGYLFAAGDLVSCASALRRAAGSLSDWSMFSAFCSGRAAEWSIDAHIEALRDLYRE